MDLTTKEPAMSDLVTDLHSEMINSVAPNYSINYEAEALASFEATGDDLMEALETRATDFIAETTGADVREDLGGREDAGESVHGGGADYAHKKTARNGRFCSVRVAIYISRLGAAWWWSCTLSL
jgi:hypothetical protein